MLNKLNELRNAREEGFTLIELLVVIVIIGVLAAIALPIFLNQQKAAIKAGMKSDVRNAVTSVRTLLVKKPTETNLLASNQAGIKTGRASDATTAATGRIELSISDPATLLNVSGGWNNFTVNSNNPNVNATATSTWYYGFDSTTGKYEEGEVGL